jgi:hypothetical protein
MRGEEEGSLMNDWIIILPRINSDVAANQYGEPCASPERTMVHYSKTRIFLDRPVTVGHVDRLGQPVR